MNASSTSSSKPGVIHVRFCNMVYTILLRTQRILFGQDLMISNAASIAAGRLASLGGLQQIAKLVVDVLHAYIQAS